MLFSEKAEIGRRLSLAVRASIPLLLLIFLVFYTILNKGDRITLTTIDWLMLVSLMAVSTYFIYSLMNLSVKETLIDQTTRLFNQKTFIKKLQEYKPTAIACLSIENLSSLDENYSTEQIDSLLYTITNKLNLLFKQYGFQEVLMGRHRGSEFLFAINGRPEHIELLLQTMIKENSKIDDIDVNYRFAIITDTDENFDQIILQLRDILSSQEDDDDEEEYTEPRKQQSSSIIKNAKELSKIERAVIESIQNNYLRLTFRPLLNIHTNHIDTYEIAVKLHCHGMEDILPRVFLPIVNRLGLGREYDFALIRHIINLLPLIDDDISFTFNLSPFSLRNSNFQEKVFSELKKTNVKPSRLIIQLYERKTHHDLSGYLKTLRDFSSHGVRICIDNFGSSNASMEYMKHFKFDMVQFDRSYVTKLENKTTNAMLHSLIQMSQELQVQTVAKWVDNDLQKEKLRQLGIDYVQGFGIASPISEEKLIDHYNS